MPGPGAGPGLGTFALLPGALPLSLRDPSGPRPGSSPLALWVCGETLKHLNLPRLLKGDGCVGAARIGMDEL